MSITVNFVFDFSIDKVPKITSPVLVIHGTEDEVIDFSHGLTIYERCPRTVEPLWVEGAGHNDVELYGQYLERLKQFINVELAVNWLVATEEPVQDRIDLVVEDTPSVPAATEDLDLSLSVPNDIPLEDAPATLSLQPSPPEEKVVWR